MSKTSPTKAHGTVRVGIGGWTYAPWRGVFYPKGLPQTQELTYASRHLTSIEVNGTFYRTQTPATFTKWARETPDDFVFSLKGPRYATNRRVLAEAGDSIERFLDSGPLALGAKLGPILWQFAPTKKFDEADFGAFLELLPMTRSDHKLRHVVEVRHASFCTPAFVKLLRTFAVPVVYSEHETYPEIADITGDFVYARLQKGSDKLRTGYAPKSLDAWAARIETWSAGGQPDDLPVVGPGSRTKSRARDVFVYFIHEGKLRAPAAAQALIGRLD
jgi:uncharacterized protein YecE (DUF72 family)